MAKHRLGYATGVFDVFHVGHLNLLRNAKALCDTLMVGVSTDELVREKGKRAAVAYEQRIEIVRNIRFTDLAIPQTTTDKRIEWNKLKFDAVFVGDDWWASSDWKEYEALIPSATFYYFPYTRGVSSTSLKNSIRKGAG